LLEPAEDRGKGVHRARYIGPRSAFRPRGGAVHAAVRAESADRLGCVRQEGPPRFAQ
jgi:hypothetical protein